MKRLFQNSICMFLLLTETNSILADDGNWPRFRGHNGTGTAIDDPRLPDTWDKEKNVAWVADIPGMGHSNPIVWGNRVIVTAVVADEENTQPKAGLYLGRGVRDPAKGVHHWMVHCFDLKSGNELWKKEVHTGQPKVPRHPKSSYAAETPVTDGKRVYVLFGDLGLYCYDMDGNHVWTRAIEPKKTFFDYGAAGSPVIHEDQVFVVYDNLEGSWIAAFDTETGEENWRKKRDEERSWATPVVWKNELRTELVVPGLKKNRSYDLKGNVLWEFDGRMSSLVIPSPFIAHGMCYIASGYFQDNHRPTFAIKPGAEGNIGTEEDDFSENEFIEWYQPKVSPYNPTQMVYGDHLYTLLDLGFMTCHNAKTGEEIYGRKRFSPRGSFTSSPWAYNGKIFCLNEDGLTYVLEHGEEYKVLHTNDLDEFCMATPAISQGRLLLRTKSKLYCITNQNAK